MNKTRKLGIRLRCLKNDKPVGCPLADWPSVPEALRWADKAEADRMSGVYQLACMTLAREVRRQIAAGVEHAYICLDCATKMGGKGDLHGVTCHVDKCEYCRKLKSLCAVSDYHWPKNYLVKHEFD